MENWRSFMEDIMRELGGEANLSNEIYSLVEQRGQDLGTNWRARVSATLQENSSDTESWNGNFDLFKNSNKGSGNWILREFDNSTIKERLMLWEKIKKIPYGELDPKFIRDLKIYKGATGICRDGNDLCISILNTGEHYPDDIYEDGILYHYPNTTRHKSFDLNEINSVKKCRSLNLPIFVILPGNSKRKRAIKLGWVEEFDDNCEWFLISFGESKPDRPEKETEFVGKIKRNKKQRRTSARGNNQPKFRVDVFKRYGSKCALCNIENKNILDAAHIIPVEENGTDDPRNGIVLCKNHHAAFDEGLFEISLPSFLIHTTHENLNISEQSLTTKTGKTPHENAFHERYTK